MSESDEERARQADRPRELTEVADRLSELQARKRKTVRWHMSRDTAERAIAAITDNSAARLSGRGKSRRRKRHKRHL